MKLEAWMLIFNPLLDILIRYSLFNHFIPSVYCGLLYLLLVMSIVTYIKGEI